MIHYDKTNSELIAHCFFAHGKAELSNYDKYFQKQEEEHIIDTIEMNADY